MVALAISGCGGEFASSSSTSTEATAPVASSSDRDAPARREVSGVVTMDGAPLPGATVFFSPMESGAAAFGTTDASGRYQLMFSRTDPGILPGRYQVRVTTAGAMIQGGFTSAETVPRIYNEESTLYRDVTIETKEIPLALESDADVRRGDRRRAGAMRLPFLNIILIVADGLGPEWIGCYGGSGVETPNIDKLAASGFRFTRVYSMPTRSAARVTLLTGNYPFRHGWVGDWDVPHSGRGCWFDWNQHQTVARRLATSEFSTHIAGQWQLNDFRRQPDALLQHGFQRWCVWTGDEHGNPPSRHQYRDPYVYLNRPLNRGADGWPDRNLRQYDWGGTGTFVDRYGPEVFAQFVKNTVSRQNGFRQFIYYPMSLPASVQEDETTRRDSAAAHEQHRAMVRYTDQLIGDLVDWLDYTKQRRRTVVIFTSDGGSPAGIVGSQDGRDVPGGRGTLTERGIRVPLIVSCPATIAPAQESDCLIDFTDLAPTICALAMLRQRAEDPVYDGRSFAPVLLGDRQDQPREWIMAMGNGTLEFNGRTVAAQERFVERVMRDHRYKVHVTTGRTIDALYDLQADPSEQQNLSSSEDPLHVEALKKFQGVVEQLPAQDAPLQYAPLAEPFSPSTTSAPPRAIGPAS